MKVELRLTADSIVAVNQLLQNIYELTATSKHEKVYRSIGFELADKFDSKAKSLIKKTSLFDTKKKHKITLKFYEAWALEIILNNFKTLVSDHYSLFRVNLVIDDLNQKLA